MKIKHNKPWAFIIAFFAIGAMAPRGASGQPPAHSETKSVGPLRLDRYGDPLPSGALARLGTKRMSHRQDVSFVQYTLDGKKLISGSHNDGLGYWDIAIGEDWMELGTNGGYAFALAKNGKTFASAGANTTILVGELDTGKKLATLSGHHADIRALALSADGSMVASAGDNNRLGLWNVTESRPERELVGHAGKVRTLSFSPDSKTLASGGDDGTLRLWSVHSGAQQQFVQMLSAIRRVVYSPSGHLLACASVKGFQVRNFAKGQVIWQNAELNDATAIAFSADGNLLAIGRDERIHLHEVSTGRSLAVLKGHLNTVSHLDFSPDGKTLASGSADNSVRLWDIASGKQRFPEYCNFGRNMQASFLTDGKTLLLSWRSRFYQLENDLISFWDPERGIKLHQLKLISFYLGQEAGPAATKALLP